MDVRIDTPLRSELGEPGRPRTSRAVVALGIGAAVAFVLFVAANAQKGASEPRIANPNVTGAPRPIEPLFGFHHWIALHQIGTVVMMVMLLVACVIGWRRRPAHPVLLMVIVCTVLSWQDPIMNWAPYAVYNPQLWHWPVNWPLVSLSPTVEPFIVIGYATFYMAPFFPAVLVLRRIQARRPVASFAWRHPLVALAALIFAFGFVLDAFLEIFLIRTQLYTYSQVLPWGSYAAGKWYQFPLIWESSLVALFMIPCGVLLYRDDTGRTQAEKLAYKSRVLRSRPALGTFAVMFLIVNAAYFFGYGGGFWLMKVTKASSSVGCPWVFPEAKVFDPQAFYEKNGEPGPYFPGRWSGWLSGQPDGRPNLQPQIDGGRCAGQDG